MKYRIVEKLKAKNNDYYNEKAPVIVFLGDSVTQGCFDVYPVTENEVETVFEQGNSYSQLMKNALNILYPKANTVIVNSGVSGGNAKNGVERFQRDVLSYNPDLLVICFGLNDSTAGEEGINTYQKSLESLFLKAKEKEIDCIFMTPNMMCTYLSGKIRDSVTVKIGELIQSTQNSGMLDRYIAAAKKTAEECGVGICDVYGKWKRLAACGVDTTDLLSNHLNHPVKEMHNLFAYALLEEIFREV